MVETRPDWCISRSRSWGVPLPLFVDRESGEPHPEAARLMADIATRMDEKGIEAWFELDPAEVLGDEAKSYRKVTDVMDVWMDSGACAPLRRRGASGNREPRGPVRGGLGPASRLVSVIAVDLRGHARPGAVSLGPDPWLRGG